MVQKIAYPVFVFIYATTACFVFSYFGEIMTAEYRNIESGIYQMSWYLMPIEVRKKVSTMLRIAQRLVLLEGFLAFNCTYEFFIKVFFAKATRNFHVSNKIVSLLLVSQYNFYLFLGSAIFGFINCSNCLK